jgi:hypothetical protein
VNGMPTVSLGLSSNRENTSPPGPHYAHDYHDPLRHKPIIWFLVIDAPEIGHGTKPR